MKDTRRVSESYSVFISVDSGLRIVSTGESIILQEGLNYSFCDRERLVLVLKVSFLSEKLL